MRLLLKLKTVNKNQLTSNYYYPLAAAVYKLLRFGSKEFAEFLHSKGYKQTGKTYKLFSFALRFDKFRMQGQVINLLKPTANLIITSPLVKEFIQNFIIGSFEEQKIEIYGSGIKTVFEIEQVESLENPGLNNTHYLKFLSPLVLATKKESNGKLIPRYYRYYDDINEITRVLNQNLMNKYKIIYDKEYTGNTLKFSWDTEYIDKRLRQNKKVTKLIRIEKKNGLTINIKANQIPFTVEGSKELIKVGYDCGFGQQNSLGFGLVDLP